MSTTLGNKISLEITNGYNPVRFPAVNNETCFNFFDFEGYMFPTPGFARLHTIQQKGTARGIFYSARFKETIVVIGNQVYKVNKDNFGLLFSINSLSGKVFFAENAILSNPNESTGNPGGQLVLSDGVHIYIFDL